MQTLPLNRQKELAPPTGPARSARRALAVAFASFNQTAGALETTYAKLQAEVSRLRRELEDKNRSLKRSLEENKRMQAYLGGIVEGLPCGVLVFDGQGDLRLINPAASRLLSAESQGSSCATPSIQRWVESQLAPLPIEDLYREQERVINGSEGALSVGITRAQLTTSGRGGDSILILRDLTEAKQLEREREGARRSQALAEVATLLAHEVRNPLGSLELFAGLLADALTNQPELQSWINYIQAGLRSLGATVNNVLQFHSQPSPHLSSVDLQQLVADTVEFLHPLARQKKMHLVWRSSGHDMTIPADPPRLQQAFFNLALNALHAMKPGGTLLHSPQGGEWSLLSDACRGFHRRGLWNQGTAPSKVKRTGIIHPGRQSRPGLGGYAKRHLSSMAAR